MGTVFKKPIQQLLNSGVLKKTSPSPSTSASPTTAEVSQSEATSANGYDSRKTKARGRSQSIITGSKGVTKTSTDYSLGKKSLLGRV